jgi:hypothetical protein
VPDDRTRTVRVVEALALGPIKRLLGLNLDGWLVAGQPPDHYRTFATEADLKQLVSWRLPHVRLPLDLDLLASADGWRALDDVLTRCVRLGLTVMVALRAADHAAFFASPSAWRTLADAWRQIAARYRDSRALFDLLDRPSPPAGVPEEILAGLGAPRLSAAAARRQPPPGAAEARAWGALANRLTQEVREIDDQAPLVVQSAGAHPASFAYLRPTRDPGTRYSFHLFAPEALTQRGAGSYPGEVAGERWDRERLERQIQPALDFARSYEAQLYLGAFGITSRAPRASRLTWTRTVLSLCRTHGIGWAYWTYRHPDFGLAVEGAVDYDLLGVLQSE